MLFLRSDFVCLYSGNVLFNVGGNPLLTWGPESCFSLVYEHTYWSGGSIWLHSGYGCCFYVVVLCAQKVVLCAYIVVMRCLI